MAAITEATYDEQFQEAVGEDATSTFETGGNYAGSNPTENAGSESLYAAGGLNAAGKTAGVDDEGEEDDDDEEDDEDEEDDLDDDEEEEEDDDLEEDDDDEEGDDDLEEDDDEEEEDDEEDDDDATLKTESSESIRGRATGAANAAARRRS